MGGSSFGQNFRISTFGESHGGGVGVVIDGCPPRLELSADHQRWTRWIHAGSRSMFASMPAEAHVGLGEVTTVDLVVVWPDGQESHHPGVDVDQVLTVRRGE